MSEDKTFWAKIQESNRKLSKISESYLPSVPEVDPNNDPIWSKNMEVIIQVQPLKSPAIRT